MFYKASVLEMLDERHPMRKCNKRELHQHSGRILREIEETGESMLIEPGNGRRGTSFIEGHTKSFGAPHLACCMKVASDVLITADENMREVAERLGIPVRWAG